MCSWTVGLTMCFAVPVEHKTLFFYWHLDIVIKHFIAEVSQLFFTKEGLLKSQLTLIIIMLMWWQRGVNTSLKSLLSSSAAVDWQIGPPSHFLFPSLVHCWPPLTNTLIWVCTWAGMPFRDWVGPSKSRWMRGAWLTALASFSVPRNSLPLSHDFLCIIISLA